MDLLANILSFLGQSFTGAESQTFWVFLVTALVLAIGVYWFQAKDGRSVKGALKYLFPKEVWWHKSSRLDYAYFVVNAFVMLLLFTPIIALVRPSVMGEVMQIFAGLGVPQMSVTPVWAPIVYFIAYVLVVDFLLFFGHWLSHKVPFLWEFHKVHHAAEVLNPMTLYRQHPVDFILAGVLVGGGTAIVHALFSHIFSEPFSLTTYGGLTLVTLLFYIFGYNLRHSHIRLSFGRILDKYLISPEQHQLHHSCVEAHFDKNMGLIFAGWDRLFKTHYVPEKGEKIILGLPNGEAAQFNKNLVACYLLPFENVFKRYKKTLAVMMVGLVGASTAAVAAGQFTPPSLHLEDLTWTEVEQAKVKGYTAVIIPTGGTEQNGPHVVLGKHNQIIRHTSEEIAKRHGKTLIAPVIAYVPEGSITPKSGHMQFTGTISVREEAFEMILEDTANSLFAHGFTDIYILGDSGDSVAAQTRAVEKISTTLKPGQRILHLTDYYSANGQVDHLLEQGFSREAIGTHAGLRDTSELIAVSPNGVREKSRLRASQDQGANGAYWRANAAIGDAMLKLKIDAALAQMKRSETIDASQ